MALPSLSLEFTGSILDELLGDSIIFEGSKPFSEQLSLTNEISTLQSMLAELDRDIQLASLARAVYFAFDDTPVYISESLSRDNWSEVSRGENPSGLKWILFENAVTKELVLTFAGTEGAFLIGDDWQTNFADRKSVV